MNQATKPRVLLIGLDTTLFTGERRGDFFARLEKYAANVEKLDAVMYTPDKGYTPKKHKNITVYPTNSSSRFNFVRDACAIAKGVIKKNKTTLLVAQDPFLTGFAGYLLKRKTGVPLYINIYSSIIDNHYWKTEQWYHPILHVLALFVLRRADGIRVECEIEAKVLERRGIARKKIVVAPVPVELQRFAEAKPLPELRKDAPVVIAAGRLSSEKDFFTYIRTAKIVEQRGVKATFLLIGGGVQEKRLKALAEKLGSANFRFVGRVPHEQIPRYFVSSSMYVLSSIYEGVPLVSVEAAAAKLPVVSTNIRDAPAVTLHSKTGLIVPVGDADAMADAIIKIIKNPEKGREMGRRGYAFVAKLYDPDKNLRDLMAHWKEVSK